MAITGSTVDASEEELQKFVKMIRMMLRDFGYNNILLDKVQFDDEEVMMAIELCVSEWNSTPPVSAVAWKSVPIHLLYIGAARYLMQSESFLQIRNQVSLQTDGLGVVGLDDKYQLYHNQMQDLKNDFKMGVRERKNADNIANGFGGISSGYAYMSRFNQS